VIDARTGAIDWMPTSALEKTYVGHYYLSNRRYDEAWDWYTKAEASGLVLETPKTIVEFFDSWIGMKNPRLYQAYCLEKLGRADEAVRYREEFARTFLMARPEKPPEGEKTPLDELLEVRSMSLWRMAAEAEMYASVNALRDGIAVFERRKRRWRQADEEREATVTALTDLRRWADREGR
jgi:tetratricopeptide (TPR) repeat protein